MEYRISKTSPLINFELKFSALQRALINLLFPASDYKIPTSYKYFRSQDIQCTIGLGSVRSPFHLGWPGRWPSFAPRRPRRRIVFRPEKRIHRNCTCVIVRIRCWVKLKSRAHEQEIVIVIYIYEFPFICRPGSPLWELFSLSFLPVCPYAGLR